MTASVERALSAVRTIRASGAEDRETDAVTGSARQAYEAGLRTARLQALVSPAGAIAIQGSFLLVLGLGGARVARGELSVADLVAFVLYLFLLVLPLGQALQAWTTLQTGLGALERIEEVLALPAEAETAPAVPLARRGPVDLELQDVDFAYAGGPPVLRGVSFRVPHGTRTALVGPSGAGKSTVLALVERFYDVTGGAVRLGGDDVRDLPRAALRASLGYVEQEAPALAGTLRDNLLLAAPGASERGWPTSSTPSTCATSSTGRPPGSTARSATAGCCCRAASASAWRSPARCSPLPRCCCSTSRRATSTPATRRRCAPRSTPSPATAPCSSWPTGCRPWSTPTRSSCSRQGRVVATGTHAELVERSPLYRELASQQLLV